jgi:hypothetical protein
VSARDRARQRANAQYAAAVRSHAAKQPPAEIDWDAVIERLKAMLDKVPR